MRFLPALCALLSMLTGCTTLAVPTTDSQSRDLCTAGGRVAFSEGDLGRAYCLRNGVPMREIVAGKRWATQGVCLTSMSSTPPETRERKICDPRLQTLGQNDTLKIDAEFHVSLLHEGSQKAYALGEAEFGPLGATKEHAAWLTFHSDATQSTFYVYFADVPAHEEKIDKWYVVEEYADKESPECKSLAPRDRADGSTNVTRWDESEECGDFEAGMSADLKKQEQLFLEAVRRETHKRKSQTGVGDGHEKP